MRLGAGACGFSKPLRRRLNQSKPLLQPRRSPRRPTGKRRSSTATAHTRTTTILRAIVNLKFAADNFPALGDYALYYLARAQRDQGDLNSSADTLARLVKTYPNSVTIDAGELMLADNLLKLGRNAEASEVASRLSARGPEASIEQGARLTEGRALVALGNPKSAYAQLMELRDKYPRSDSDADARVLVHQILAAHPEVADTNSLAYHRDESRVAAARRRAVRS